MADCLRILTLGALIVCALTFGACGDGRTGGALSFRTVSSVEGLEAALEARDGRPVLVEVCAEWAVTCKQYEALMRDDPQIRQALRGFQRVRIDVTSDMHEDIRARIGQASMSQPSYAFFGADGALRQEAALHGWYGPETADRMRASIKLATR